MTTHTKEHHVSEIARWQAPTEVATTQPPAVTTLVEWAQEADAAYNLAQRVANSPFCPEAFRGNPGNAAVAMLAGYELGLSPLQALGAFDVIQGRAAARAITLRALVQSKGHDIVLVESTMTRAVMKGRRNGASDWQTVTWTMDRAKQLQLTGKPNWKNQPQTMLVARATSELCRLVAADALLGIGGGYSTEEIADGAGPDVTVTVADAPTKTRLSRTQRPAPVVQVVPDVDDEPEVDADGVIQDPPAQPAPTADRITDPQMKRLQVLLSKANITDRDAKLAFAADTIGRDLSSATDLTKTEASQVMDALSAIVDAPVVEEPPGWEQDQ